jgi:ribosome-associated heat shock protein Hsp15
VSEGARIDSWLWAARFFKTRSLAKQAIEGGKVQVDGAKAKPSKAVQPGDVLDIRKGDQRWTVVVEAVASKRGPARVAESLYRETEESVAARQQSAEQIFAANWYAWTRAWKRFSAPTTTRWRCRAWSVKPWPRWRCLPAPSSSAAG